MQAALFGSSSFNIFILIITCFHHLLLLLLGRYEVSVVGWFSPDSGYASWFAGFDHQRFDCDWWYW